MLPFTPDRFFEVFAGYNAAIWPAQVLAESLGIVDQETPSRPHASWPSLLASAR